MQKNRLVDDEPGWMARLPTATSGTFGFTSASGPCLADYGGEWVKLFPSLARIGPALMLKSGTGSSQGLHRVELRDSKGRPVEALLEIRYRRIKVLPPIGEQRRYPELRRNCRDKGA